MFTAHPSLPLLLLMSLGAAGVGCGEDGELRQRPEGDQGDGLGDMLDQPDDLPDQPAPPDPQRLACLAHCELLRGCEAVPDEADCDALCDALQGSGAYSEGCQRCVASGCEAASGCLSDDASACGAPAVQLTVGARELPAGRDAQGILRRWDGSLTPAYASTQVGDEGVALLSYGLGAVHAGIKYQADYFIDANSDGVCEPDADLAGRLPIFIETASILSLSPGTAHEQGDAALLCEGFESRASLCEARCLREEQCANEGAGLSCQSTCEADPIASTLACARCHEGRDCAAQATACYGPGGVCERDYIAPDASLLAGASAVFPDDAGLPVIAQVRHAGGNLIGAAQPINVRDDGGFLLTFGEIVWRGQDYTIQLFLDRDTSGQCDSGEPAYALPITVNPDTALLYQTFTLEQLSAIDCDAFER